MTTTAPASTATRLMKEQHRPPIFSSQAPVESPLVLKKQRSLGEKKVKSHVKKASWEAFDPLLATDNVGSGVWGGSTENHNDAAHPLKTGNPPSKPADSQRSTPSQNKKAKPPTHQKSSQSKSHRKAKSSSSPRHKKSKSIDELRQIAQELAISKPASFVAEQNELINTWQSDRFGGKNKRSTPKIRHRKAQSLGNNDIFNILSNSSNEDEDALIRTASSKSAPTTPEVKVHKKKPATIGAPERKSARHLRGPTTPERKKRNSSNNFLTPPRWNHKAEDLSPTIPPPPEMPRLTPLHGFLTHKDNLTMRSSEQDPSNHQVEIPSSDDFLMHSRLCAVMEQYRVVDQNFEFGSLVRASRMTLQGFVASSTNKKSRADESNAGGGLDNLIQDHVPIVQSLLECADDLVLEGFFPSESKQNTHDRIEAAVFNSQSRRQFVVVYRGTTDQQVKPVRNKHNRAAPVRLIGDQPVGVFPAFRDAYFKGGVENKVFALLDDLAEKYPFCDVVMTGHSFGAALATIAAQRFASAREMLCVSCHAFGSPKVGNSEWKHLVNSQPNLKVMRVEHSTDPAVLVPSDNNVYMHVGHTLQVQQPDHRGSKQATSAPSSPSRPSSPVAVVAYRFERNKPIQKSFLGLYKRDNKAQEIRAYVRSMEQFARMGQAWVKQFAGEDVGKGVRGTGNEKRLVV